jgi:hypothetical protein
MFYFPQALSESYDRRTRLTQLVCALATTGPNTSLDPKEIVELAGEFLHEIEMYDREAAETAKADREKEEARKVQVCKNITAAVKVDRKIAGFEAAGVAGSKMIDSMQQHIYDLRRLKPRSVKSENQIKDLQDKIRVIREDREKQAQAIRDRRESLIAELCKKHNLPREEFCWDPKE